jgi:hypothetical protein
MEEAIRGDFAFVKAWKGDTAGKYERFCTSLQSLCLCILGVCSAGGTCESKLTACQAILYSSAPPATSTLWSPLQEKSQLPKWSTLLQQVHLRTRARMPLQHMASHRCST